MNRRRIRQKHSAQMRRTAIALYMPQRPPDPFNPVLKATGAPEPGATEGPGDRLPLPEDWHGEDSRRDRGARSTR